MDQCYSAQWDLLPCTLTLYAINPSCVEECGDSPRATADIPVSQCYKCRTSFSSESYETRYSAECCAVYKCQRMDMAPKSLTWNLLGDGKAIDKEEIEISRAGDCSDLTDLTSDCCRLTCLDCFANLTVASMFADVDLYLTDVTVDAEMVLRGNTNATLKLFAPNGCRFESTKTLFSIFIKIPISAMFSISMEYQFSAIAKATIKPHGSTTMFGVASTIDRVSAGFKDFDNTFRDVQMSSQMHRHLKQAGLDATASLIFQPEVTAKLIFLDDKATVGMHSRFQVYAELQATVVFPEPMPALLRPGYNPYSLLRVGDCRTPHFMTFDVFVGVSSIEINFPITVLGFTSFDPSFTLAPIRLSVISGCIASAYTTYLPLSLATSAVASWTKSHKLKLLAAVLRLLDFTDIHADSLELTEASDDSNGRMFVAMQVPPSVADKFPTESLFSDDCIRLCKDHIVQDPTLERCRHADRRHMRVWLLGCELQSSVSSWSL